MTFDHDPDRLIDAWLDEGPRSFSPRLLDRTLAAIHASPRQRRRFAPWRFPTMSLPMKTAVAAGLVLALAAGTGGLLPLLPRVTDGPAASPSPVASVPASPSPTGAPPVTDYLTGDPQLVGPTWRLVGFASDGGYAAALAEAPATIAFSEDLTFRGTTGCRDISGALTRLSDLPPKRAQTEPASIVLDAHEEPACGEPIDTQDRAVIDALPGMGGYQVTAGGPELLASGLTAADLAPALAAHYEAWPDLVRLIIRDQSGEGTLVYAPTAGEEPQPSGAPTLSFLPGTQRFLGTPWVLVGWIDDGGRYRAADAVSLGSLQFTSQEGTDRFTGSTGCRPVGGDWTRGLPARGGGDTRTLGLSVDDPDARITCPARLEEQDIAVLEALRGAGAVTMDVQGTDSLAPDLAREDVDDALWQHFTDHPDLTRLVLRGSSGEATLVFAPYAGQG